MIDVCCAIIHNDDSDILLVQRGEDTDHPLQWEFPGGKIKNNENPEDSIIREIDEELTMDIIITGNLPPVKYDYGFKQVCLFPFLCDTLSDEPELTEHLAYKWVKASGLDKINLCAADIIVAEEYSKRNMPGYKGVNESGDELNTKDRNNIKEMLTGKGGYGACDILADNIINDNKVLDLMIDYSLSANKTLAFRASYCIIKAEEKAPGIVERYYGLFAESLQKLENESVIRAFLKMLNTSDLSKLNENQQGILAEYCFTWLKSAKSAIAIKAYSMEALYKLSLIYPELVTELRLSILSVMEGGSAGIKARGQQILKLLPS